MFKRKITTTALTAVAMLTGATGVASAVEAPAFSDTPVTMEHYEHVVWAKDNNIANGWKNGTFRPYEPISREAVAALLYRYMDHDEAQDEALYPGNDCFPDVNPNETQFYKEICWIKGHSIAFGWKDGTFRPHEPISREALSAFMFRIAELREMSGGNRVSEDEYTDILSTFVDVYGTQFTKEVAWAAEHGLLKGWNSDNKNLAEFRPHDDIQRVAVVTMLHRIAETTWGKEFRHNLIEEDASPNTVEKTPEATVEDTPEATVEDTPEATPEWKIPVEEQKKYDSAVSHMVDMSKSKCVPESDKVIVYPTVEYSQSQALEYIRENTAGRTCFDSNGEQLSYEIVWRDPSNGSGYDQWTDVIVTFTDGTVKAYEGYLGSSGWQ